MVNLTLMGALPALCLCRLSRELRLSAKIKIYCSVQTLVSQAEREDW